MGTMMARGEAQRPGGWCPGTVMVGITVREEAFPSMCRMYRNSADDEGRPLEWGGIPGLSPVSSSVSFSLSRGWRSRRGSQLRTLWGPPRAKPRAAASGHTGVAQPGCTGACIDSLSCLCPARTKMPQVSPRCTWLPGLDTRPWWSGCYSRATQPHWRHWKGPCRCTTLL